MNDLAAALPSPPVAALTIAGSDSGGGAGIQADLRTFFAHGILGTTAITAVTAQNTLGVTAWEPIGPQLVAAQIEAVLGDLPVRAIKTGMLGTTAVIEAVHGALNARSQGLPLVLDPVMVSTSGHRLLDADAEEALMRRLLPCAHVLTPNLPEAAVLSGLDLAAPPGAHASVIRGLAPRAWIVIKGGHGGTDSSIDAVFGPSGEFFELNLPRVPTSATHGTGCTLSAAIASALALGSGTEDAIRHGRAFVQRALEAATPIGAGHGPVNHLFAHGVGVDRVRALAGPPRS